MSGITGNPDFVRLWTQHAQRVYAYLLTLVHNRADADELLQETAITLWEKFAEFQPGTDFRAWACTVAFNKVRNFRQIRGARAMQLEDDVLDLVNDQAVADADLLSEQHHWLSHCYEKLRPIDQDLVSRRYREGASTKNIASEVGRSVDAVYKSLNRIHDTLLECVRRSMSAGAQ